MNSTRGGKSGDHRHGVQPTSAMAQGTCVKTRANQRIYDLILRGSFPPRKCDTASLPEGAVESEDRKFSEH